MWTTEFDHDATIITVLCDKDDQEDVEVIIREDGTVFIRQFQEYKNEYDIITLTYAQLQDIMAAMNKPEGAFRMEWINK